jgi:hypothetical protein
LAQDDSLSDERRKSGDFVVSCVIAVVIITAKPIEKKETRKKSKCIDGRKRKLVLYTESREEKKLI